MKQYFILATLVVWSLSGFAQSMVQPFASYHFNNGSLEDGIGDIDAIKVGNVLSGFDRFGNPDHAFAFVDSSALSMGDNFDIFSSPGAKFSFSFWIKSQDLSLTNVSFISKYGNSNCGEQQREFFIRYNDDRKIEFLFYSDIGGQNFHGIETVQPLNDTCWHHIVINYDGQIATTDGVNRIDIFFDGQNAEIQKSATQRGIPSDIKNATAPLAIGTPLGTNDNICFFNAFPGLIDDIDLFDQLLSEQDVLQLFTSPSPTGVQSRVNAEFSVSNTLLCLQSCLEIKDLSSSDLCNTSSTWFFSGGTLDQGSQDQPQSLCYENLGTYSITHILGNGYLRDTFEIEIEVMDDKADILGPDTFFCENTMLRLESKITNAIYKWSDSSTGSSITVDKEGDYWIEVTENGCILRDTISVEKIEIPEVDLGTDQEICGGDSIALDATSPLATFYLWQDGSMESDFSVVDSGLYFVEVGNQCGSNKDSINIVNIGSPIEVNLGRDTSFCEEDTIILDASTTNGLNYLWNTGSTNNQISVTTPGIYQVTVSNECFEDSDELIVDMRECCPIYVPNAFSPDGNGINDTFRVLTACEVENFLIRIFNRWGALVFESNNISNSWNGTFRNQSLPIGVYTWFIEYVTEEGQQLKTGTVTLVH